MIELPLSSKEKLMYWIGERYDILLKKKNGGEKPWSADPIFQRTFFCNVRREDDKVTRFVRDFYSPMVDHPMFEYNIILARFLNWPPTLTSIGFQETHSPARLNSQLRDLATKGKIWGGAYVITTHGQPMPKVDYLTNQVLEAAFERVDAFKKLSPPLGGRAYLALLEGIGGIGSFLAGQVIADLKNTPGHPAASMTDWWDFVVPGPGSIRGCNWFWENQESNRDNFRLVFPLVRAYADRNWPSQVPKICNQDLQNCLCEYDKYRRVEMGTGRSKRNYEGA